MRLIFLVDTRRAVVSSTSLHVLTVTSCALMLVSTVGAVAAATPSVNQVAGNLILFNDNGAWSWYQDERAIVDTRANKLLVSSVAASPLGVHGVRDGHVDLTTFNLETGERSRFVLGTIEEDDHNLAALLKRPDCRYLAVYANHNTDRLTRYRISQAPEDSLHWGQEQHFDWRTTPGNDFNVTYSNVFYLSAEDRVYNFARVNDRSPNMMLSHNQGDTWTYGGQLTRSEGVGYVNGYFKYASNGVDRIHLIATEAHPRDYNNGIYHAYIQGGKLYSSGGQVIDDDIHDGQNIPATKSLTPVFLPDREDGMQQRHRAWTTDLALDAQGLPYALFTTRAGDAVPSRDGADDDRRLYYARFDGTEWRYHEVAKMGKRLFDSEQDYTGLGALVPGDPDTIYISSTFDPATGRETPFHEIYKGKTADGGQSWQWTPITANSTVDNLRPIVPAWDSQNRAILWFRGLMFRSQAYKSAIVGVIERDEQATDKVNYVDATTENTRAPNANSQSGELANDVAADSRAAWVYHSGIGSKGCFRIAAGSPTDNQSLLATRIEGLDEGTYDLFVYFWSTPDGKGTLRAGTSPDSLLPFSETNSQQAERKQFADSATVVVSQGERRLYRGYVGRVQGGAKSPNSIFFGGSVSANGEPLSWYAGWGYARVTDVGSGTSPVRSAELSPANLSPSPAAIATPRNDRNSQLAHRQLLNKAKSGRVDLYFIGDSIIRRWGATDYPELLAHWQKCFHGWNAGNFAWGADSTQHMIWRLENGELDGVEPKVIVVLAGTNNIGSSPPDVQRKADELTAGIREIIRICREKAPRATVVVIGITPRNDDPSNPLAAMATIRRTNEQLAKLADGKTVRFLNVNDKLADSQGRLFHGLAPDKLHLSLAGYQVLADGLRPLLAELLGPPNDIDLSPAPTGDPSAAK